MKLLATMVMVAATLWAGSAGEKEQRTVVVCLDAGGHSTAVDPARAVASRIFLELGVRLMWRSTLRPCIEASTGIVIRLSLETPKTENPGALAYALPFEGKHIVLMYDRVVASFTPSAVPRVMGYVLAHEIGHILQCTAKHSTTGILKARWDSNDYGDMQMNRLRFSEEDVELIQSGLARFDSATTSSK